MSEYLKARNNYLNNKIKYKDYYDTNMEHRKETDVKNGSWILVIKTIPVSERAKPLLYGIYWGVPNDDKCGRQTCRIRTTEDVVLLNHEFSVIDENRLKEYRELGWELNNTQNTKTHESLNLELIEKGRSLTEEEREVIMSLQLDGLTEMQACEEYFLSRHTDDSNYTICYLPNIEARKELYNYFGERR